MFRTWGLYKGEITPVKPMYSRPFIRGPHNDSMYNDWLRRPTLWFEHIVFMSTLKIGEIHQFLGGGFKHFLCSPRNLGKIPILPYFFQMGWFNHQLDFNAYFETNSLAQAPTGEVHEFRNQIQPVVTVVPGSWHGGSL